MGMDNNGYAIVRAQRMPLGRGLAVLITSGYLVISQYRQ